MDARSMRIPSQVNMAEDNKSRKLCQMADPHQTQRQKYYPDTNVTPKGHMNQKRKNVQSTKHAPLESFVGAEMKGKKVSDVYVKVYDTRETMFSDQTGQFPTQSKQGNK